MNIRIWEIGTLNQPFIRGSYNELNVDKNKNYVVSGKSAFFVIGQFCTTRSICHNIDSL